MDLYSLIFSLSSSFIPIVITRVELTLLLKTTVHIARNIAKNDTYKPHIYFSKVQVLVSFNSNSSKQLAKPVKYKHLSGSRDISSKEKFFS